MNRLNSINDFDEFTDRLKLTGIRGSQSITISAGTCGLAAGAADVIKTAKQELIRWGLTERIELRITGCFGGCAFEPAMMVEPGGLFYPNVGTKETVRIVRALTSGTILEDLIYEDPATARKIERTSDIGYFRNQDRPLLDTFGKADPIRIYNYLSIGGYGSFVSKLRLHRKSRVKSRTGVIRCSGTGGDGCNLINRRVYESSPHAVIEGMLLDALTERASCGEIHVDISHPLAIKHLRIALRQTREKGLLGQRILGTDFDFDIDLVLAGEGCKGATGKESRRTRDDCNDGENPVAIHTAEAFARMSAAACAPGSETALKTDEKSASATEFATKLVHVSGDVRYPGLIEVAKDTTLGRIVYGICGGGRDGEISALVLDGGCCAQEIEGDFNVPFGSKCCSDGIARYADAIYVLNEKSLALYRSLYPDACKTESDNGERRALCK